MKNLNQISTLIQKGYINCIYGQPATGKTTLCLMFVANKLTKKVFFIDTENSFSLDRFKQISNIVPANFVLFKVKSFKEQMVLIEKLLNLKPILGRVIIDSLTVHYRKELQAKHDVNSKFSKQLSILSELAREGIDVIVTSQVYQSFDNEIKPVGSNMLKNWSGVLIRLEKDSNQRRLILEKHPKQYYNEIKFEIVDKGLNFI